MTISFMSAKALSVIWMIDPDTGQSLPAPVQSIDWRENSVEIQVGRIKKGATFIFAQPAYSGWVAFANGHQIDLGRHEIFLSLTIPNEIEYIEFASDLGYMRG